MFEHAFPHAPSTNGQTAETPKQFTRRGGQSETANPCLAGHTDSLNPEPRHHPKDGPLNPSPGGRPRKLDEISRREICALISAGCGVQEAAKYVGCAATTIRREAARNADFEESLRQAYLAAELAPLNAMRRAATSHWRAAAWLLERTNPQRFAKQNPKLLKPDELEQHIRIFADLVQQEVPDPESRERFQQRLQKMMADLERQAYAAWNPLPKKRHPRRVPSPNSTSAAGF